MPRIARLIALPALLLLLFAPAAARADDQSFARAALTQGAVLGPYEKAALAALAEVDRSGLPAVPAARVAIRRTRRELGRLIAAMRRERTSSREGATVKRELVAVMGREQQGYGMLDSMLVAFRADDQATARLLLKRAKRTLRQVSRDVAVLAPRVRALAIG